MTRLGAFAWCLLAGLALIFLAMLAACESSDKPATPTPLPSAIVATSVPTPPYSHIRVRVIGDADADGQADANEQGIAGALLFDGCSDHNRGFRTDELGYIFLPFGADSEEDTCIYLIRDVGWQPTSAASLRFDDYPERGVIEFLVHDLGDGVTEVHGDAIRGGLPVTDLGVATIAPPFTGPADGCAVSFYEDYGMADTIVIIVGSGARPGCPSARDAFDIVADGEIVASDIVFAPGDIIWHDFVVGDDSMRFHASADRAEVLDAEGNVLGSDCAVVLDHLGVFVLPDSVRAGCGAPGRIVRFFSDTGAPEPPYYWQAGRVKHQPPYPVSTLVPAPAQFAQ